MEARAFARVQAERAEKQPDQPGPPPAASNPNDQYNFTDPESRIMPAGGSGRFEQAYNAQAAVEVNSRLIVGQRVTQATNDKEQFVPTLQSMEPAAGPVQEVLIDSGFVSKKAVRQVEQDEHAQPTGTTVLAAVNRDRHCRTVARLEKQADPPAPPDEAPWLEQLAHRTATAAGRARYKLRQQTVEPVFGIIKEALGFRRFLLRGLDNVSLEWTLVTLAYILKRFHTLGTKFRTAWPGPAAGSNPGKTLR